MNRAPMIPPWDAEVDRWARTFRDVDAPELNEIGDMANGGLELFNNVERYGRRRQEIGLGLMRKAYSAWLRLPYSTLRKIHQRFKTNDPIATYVFRRMGELYERGSR